MKLPARASKVVIYYGAVYVESPGYPEAERGTWSVWDPRPVRQGARQLGSGLSFAGAEALALKACHPETDTKGQADR